MASAPDAAAEPTAVVYTIGHSTHPLAAFNELLTTHRIAAVADVRSYPTSRRWPQFNQAALRDGLATAGIAYDWLPVLGGRRSAKTPDSPHTAWKVAAFRAYADHADSPAWADGLAALMAMAAADRTAIMCAEGLWWQCHRRIIADHLTVARPRRWSVRHILPDGKLADHVLPEFASLRDGRLIYDGGQPRLGP